MVKNVRNSIPIDSLFPLKPIYIYLTFSLNKDLQYFN